MTAVTAPTGAPPPSTGTWRRASARHRYAHGVEGGENDGGGGSGEPSIAFTATACPSGGRPRARPRPRPGEYAGQCPHQVGVRCPRQPPTYSGYWRMACATSARRCRSVR
ncbi:hypothetical protein NKG94_26380 [Micromonospora sp. M12]